MSRVRDSRGDERAFTIVEVLVAVLLLTAVVGGIALAVAGSSSLRGSARLQASLTATGQNIQEQLAQDRGWMSQCTTLDAKCDAIESKISNNDLKLDDVDGAATLDLPGTFAVAVDSRVDGTGNGDRDGVIPDYYRISVTIMPSAEVAARYATTPERASRTFVTSIDRSGKEQVGSLTVQACKVLNQIDERMSIQGCRPDAAGARTDVKMNPCPPVPLAPGHGCINAWNWVKDAGPSAGDPSPFISLSRVTLPTFQVVSSTGDTYSSNDAEFVDGEYRFTDLPAGVYNIKGLPATSGPNTERWYTKEIPAYHGTAGNPANRPTVSVEPGIMSRALVLFRPGSTGDGIDLQFERQIGHYYVYSEKHNTETVFIKKPTKKYTGVNAQAYCDKMAEIDAQFNGMGGIAYTVVVCEFLPASTPNCVRVHLEWTATEMGEYFAGDLTKKTCTYASQWIKHRFYTREHYDEDVVKGAPFDADYELRPAPDYRASRTPNESSSSFTPRHEYCLVDGHVFGDSLGSDSRRCRSGVRIDDLEPGLHGPLLDTDNHADNNRALALRDDTNGGSGAWIYSPMWVRTDGRIISQTAGDRGVNPEVVFVGKGECYWHAPLWWSGKVETARDACGPCNTVYKDKQIYEGACALLDRTCLSRDVWEDGDFGYTALSGYATDAPDCHNYGSNPWVCSSRPATTLDGNCNPPGPPPTIGPKNYPSPNGNAEVGGGKINSTDFSA